MKLDIYSHCFTVSDIENRFEMIIRKLSRQNAEFIQERDEKTGQTISRISKMWSFSVKEGGRYNFHIYYLPEFMGFVNQNEDLKNSIKITNHVYSLSESADAFFTRNKMFDPREYQETLINHTVTTTEATTVITLPPGAGKTLTSFHIFLKLQKRVFILMRGGYLDRWIPDLEKNFNLDKGDLLVVRGQGDLINLMEMAHHGELKAKIIMTTIDTVANYIEDYCSFPEIRGRYRFEPVEMFKGLGVGVVCLDEGHQNPHKVMRVMCHTNVPKWITLSATLETRDPFINKRYQVMYPTENRHNAGYRNVYIGVNALMYRFNSMKGIRTSGYMGAYSHTNFEASLMKAANRSRKMGYLENVKYSIDLLFMKDYKPGTKCLVFCGTVKMCDEVVKFLSPRYPNLKVGRYVSKDKMTVLENSDIIISTVQSSGTAVDIINLRTSIMTTALDSQIANEQSLGRTRPVRDYPELTPVFAYWVCIDIPKHLQYHRNKRQAFNGLVKYHSEIYLPPIK